MSDSLRSKIVSKILLSLIGLGVSSLVSYSLIKMISKFMDPSYEQKMVAKSKAEALLRQLGIDDIELNEHEFCIATNLLDTQKLTVNWTDVGGLDHVVKDIMDTLIYPLKCQRIVKKSKLLMPPKGILLYGPPGCGKTMLAKAAAKAAGARFINLQISVLLDKWYGESQKRTEALFSLAEKLQPCIVFIDEIDSFLRSRSSDDHESTALIKTQFMTWWDGIATDPTVSIVVIGATNRPQDVDAAIKRRMPAQFYISLPDEVQRKDILRIILAPESVCNELDYTWLAMKTEGFSGSDLLELCRYAMHSASRHLLKEEVLLGDASPYIASLPPITQHHFELALSRRL